MYFWLQDCGRNLKSPNLSGLSSEPQPPQQLQPIVNPIQELLKLSHDMFDSPCAIEWDQTIFGVDNGGIPLYVSIQDIIDVVQGTQMVNIAVIQLWMM